MNGNSMIGADEERFLASNVILLDGEPVTSLGSLPANVSVRYSPQTQDNSVSLSSPHGAGSYWVNLASAVNCAVTIGSGLQINTGQLGVTFISNAGRPSRGSTVVVGENCVQNGSVLCVAPFWDQVLIVGDNCLFASNVTLRASSHHTLFSLDDGVALNVERGISIGSHVWFGQDVLVLNRSVIGNDCVVAARSMVNSDLGEANCLIAGVPAKVKRRGIGWDTRLHDDTRYKI